MQIKQEVVTPQKAEGLLKRNTNNRNIRVKHVRKLAKAMEKGEWQPENPAPICVNGTQLLDGQHRLMAVVESGATVKMWVARGAKKAVMSSMDTGLARNMRDTLQLGGYSYPGNLGGILNQVWLYTKERVIGGKPSNWASEADHADLLRLLEQHPELEMVNERLSAAYHGGAKRGEGMRALGSLSIAGAAYWAFSQVDEEDADAFFEGVITGAGLEPGNPILALRKLTLEARHKPPPRVIGACIVKTWNAWREGRSMYHVAWKGGGKSPEAFPEVR